MTYATYLGIENKGEPEDPELGCFDWSKQTFNTRNEEIRYDMFPKTTGGP